MVHYASAAAIIFFIIILALTALQKLGIEKIRSLCIRKETPHDRKTEKAAVWNPFNSRSTGYDVSFYLASGEEKAGELLKLQLHAAKAYGALSVTQSRMENMILL